MCRIHESPIIDCGSVRTSLAVPDKSGISNEVGCCQEVFGKRFSVFFLPCGSFGLPNISSSSTPLHLRGSALSLDESFSFVDRCSVSTLSAQPRVPSSLRYCPPNISSVLTDQSEKFVPGPRDRMPHQANPPFSVHLGCSPRSHQGEDHLSR